MIKIICLKIKIPYTPHPEMGLLNTYSHNIMVLKNLYGSRFLISILYYITLLSLFSMIMELALYFYRKFIPKETISYFDIMASGTLS